MSPPLIGADPLDGSAEHGSAACSFEFVAGPSVPERRHGGPASYSLEA